MIENVMEQQDQRKRMHPHKFNLYIAMGSIVMMFAGLTSAYIVQKASSDWLNYTLPSIFWVSTSVILFSSVTIQMGQRAFRQRAFARYKQLITTTLILGVLFGVFQFWGFMVLWKQGISLGVNSSGDFLYIIFGLHLVHILGGIIALLIVFFRAFRTRVKVYNTTGLEIVATYWHFVDVLWIYLFVFFLANQ